MKQCLRCVRLLSLLLLVAIVWPGGARAGEAVNEGPLAQKELPRGSPNIVSFVATPSTVRKGEAAILAWQISDAEHIWLSGVEPPDAAECLQAVSGETRVRPVNDTTYTLHAWGRGITLSRQVTVQVIDTIPGFCTISGQIAKDRPEYSTTVGLHVPGSRSPLFSTAVDGTGRYNFPRVPTGIYEVRPQGKYPVDEFSAAATPQRQGPVPRSRSVSCEPNGSHPADFRIGSTEG